MFCLDLFMSCDGTIVTVSLYVQVVTLEFHDFLPYILDLTFFPVPHCDDYCALTGLNDSSEIMYSNIHFQHFEQL